MFDESKYWFKVMICINCLFNGVTGGDWGVCFSTRTYINSRKSKKWDKVRLLIDAIFWKNHCKDSYLWEIKVKKRWINAKIG